MRSGAARKGAARSPPPREAAARSPPSAEAHRLPRRRCAQERLLRRGGDPHSLETGPRQGRDWLIESLSDKFSRGGGRERSVGKQLGADWLLGGRALKLLKEIALGGHTRVSLLCEGFEQRAARRCFPPFFSPGGNLEESSVGAAAATADCPTCLFLGWLVGLGFLRLLFDFATPPKQEQKKRAGKGGGKPSTWKLVCLSLENGHCHMPRRPCLGCAWDAVAGLRGPSWPWCRRGQRV